MMRSLKTIVTAVLFAAAAVSLKAQTDSSSVRRSKGRETIVLGSEIMPRDSSRTRRLTNRLIAPKGEWQCGLSVMYADFSSGNSEYMLLLQGVGASASMLRLAPEAAYTFAPNHSVGARFQYTNVRGMVDSATADLLGNFSTSVEDMHALSRSMSGCIFQRTYVGLDRYGRVGIFWDYVLGYTRTKSQFYSGSASSDYSLKKKVHLGFAPGIVYFPMNNLSIQVSVCLADLSYNNVTAWSEGKVVGTRNAWKAQAHLNIMDITFGLTIHL